MEANELRKKSSLGIQGIYIVAQNELIAFFRNKGLILSQITQPILYLIFIVIGINSSIDGVKYNGVSISYAQYALIGIFSILIISQTSQAIYRVTVDKRFGMMALKLSSGVKPYAYVLGIAVYPFIGFLVQTTVLYIISLFFSIGISISSYYLTVLFGLVVLLFWVSFGIIITMFINDYQKRDVFISFLLTPLGFTAPAFYILDTVPFFIKIIAYVNPLTYQLEALRSITFKLSNYETFALLILMTAIMFVIVVKLIPRINLVLKER